MTTENKQTIIKALAFMASVIKSGEEFTDEVDDIYCEAVNILKNDK